MPVMALMFGLNFNPRLREGGDDIQYTHSRSYENFNPRLREGGDNKPLTVRLYVYNFNPRLREGGDMRWN